jgi:hypothetical protein
MAETSERAETDEQSKQDGTSEPSKPQEGESGEPSETDKPGKQDESSEDSVKSELVGTYMYLHDDLKDDLGTEFKRLDFELDGSLDEELEKNRDFYNLIVELGLEAARDMNTDELVNRIEDRRNI